MTTASTASLEGDHSVPADGDGRQQFVTFGLQGRNFCVDIMSVREIRMVDAVTPVPGSEPHVRGVINLRGNIIPMIDLRARFGEGEQTLLARQPAVIVQHGDRIAGLLVDVVSDIITVSAGEIAPLPETGGRGAVYFSGLVKQSEAMAIIVNLHRLIETAAPTTPARDQ